MDIEAYILIGGRSRRLGIDKAFARIGGMTLAERALVAVRESGIAAKTTFVAASETQFPDRAISLNAPLIFDQVEGRGPLGGLHAALFHSQTEWIFLLACDYPFVSADLVRLLAHNISDDFGAVVPIQPDGRPQPLCAFYNVAAARSVVEEIVYAPIVPPPMRDIVNSINPRLVTSEEYAQLAGSEHFFANLNTADDLNEIKKLI